LVAAVFRFEQAQSPANIEDIINLLIEWLTDRPDLKRMFALWIRATLMRKQNYSILLPQIDDLQEIKVMLADRLEEWAHSYIAEGELKGELKGLQQGEMLALQRLLAKRFGVIPMETVSLISQAPLEDIERWFDRAIDATKLSDVFTD
jgi:flagellar biosynthesis/type III secretory pathway protein FliH